MIRNFKVGLGLSLLAALVFSSMSVMSASATDPGVGNHFDTETPKSKFTVTENTSNAHHITLSAYGSTVECHNPQYSVHHTSTTTFTSLTVTPINDTLWNCTNGSGDKVEVHFKGCHYQFTAKNTNATHATVHFICPTGVKTEVTTPAGTMRFGTQTPTLNGATYTNIVNPTTGKHEVTVNVTAEGIHAECHGLCQFLGTNTTTAKMNGSATVAAFNTDTGVQTNLTAT